MARAFHAFRHRPVIGKGACTRLLRETVAAELSHDVTVRLKDA
jgi:hypothetical protein